jgi:hypothetical protein
MVAANSDIGAPPPVAHGLRIEVGKGDAGHVAAAADAVGFACFPVCYARDAGELEQF